MREYAVSNEGEIGGVLNQVFVKFHKVQMPTYGEKKCKICGLKMTMYNPHSECLCHSVALVEEMKEAFAGWLKAQGISI